MNLPGVLDIDIRIGILPQSWILLAERSQSVSHRRSLEVIGGHWLDWLGWRASRGPTPIVRGASGSGKVHYGCQGSFPLLKCSQLPFPTYKIKVGWGKLSIYHIWEIALQQAWRNYLCGWEIFFFAKMVVWRAYIANISIRQATSTTSANYQPELQQDAKQTLEKLRLKSIFRPLPIETFFLLPCFLVILWTYFWRNKKLA